MSGWIKLHRKILDNPVVCKDSDHIAVWTYLLLNATHKEYPALFAGKKIMLQPGQLITGRKSIAEKFKISESKVQRILKTFEIEQQIEQQNSNKNRLVTILSWHDYQDIEHQDEQQVNNKRTTTEQQVNTNKNVKNVKNERSISTTSTTETENEALGDIYTKVCGTFVMPENFRQFFNKIREQGYSEAFCKELLLEASESAGNGKLSIRFLESIRDRWTQEGITSRQQARENKNRGDLNVEPKGLFEKGLQSRRTKGAPNGESEYAFLDFQNRTGS